MSLPPLAFLAQALQQRRRPQLATGAAPGLPTQEDLTAALADDLEPGRVPMMRAEDPDFLQQQLAPLDQEGEALQAQLEQAKALMQGAGRQYSTPLGAGLGGLADALRMGVGAYRQDKAQEQMGELAKRRGATVEAAGRNPSASAVQRDESRRGRLLQRSLQGSQQDFQAGQQTERLGAQAAETAAAEVRARRADEARALTDAAAQEEGLRKEISGNTIVKEYQSTLVARDALAELANKKSPTPADDLAIVFGTMKILDPTSVVRETEQIQVRNAASLPDRALNYIQRVNSGLGLSNQQRQELMAMADSQVRAREGVVRQIYSGYEPIVQRMGLNSGNVFPFRIRDAQPPRQEASAPEPRAKPRGNPKSIVSKETMADGTEIVVYGDGRVVKRIPEE